MDSAVEWNRIDVQRAPASLPVCVGGDELDVATMFEGYRRGAYPFPAHTEDIYEWLEERFGSAARSGAIPNLTPDIPPSLKTGWWSPDPRGIIDVDAPRIFAKLRRRLRTCGWETTADVAFADVVVACRRGEGNRLWLTERLGDAFERLHAAGHAHSVEVWEEGELIGGVFGVQVGGVFTGHSMFRRRSDASRIAVVDLMARFREGGGRLFDTIDPREHFRRLGAVDMSRRTFLQALAEVRDADVDLPTDRLPVERLVDKSSAHAL